MPSAATPAAGPRRDPARRRLRNARMPSSRLAAPAPAAWGRAPSPTSCCSRSCLLRLVLRLGEWAELDEVTRGDGKVIPSRQVQVVQNLEGGIVAVIEAREGAVVERGQVLVRIDNVRAASDLRENRQRHLALLGALGRLRAEVEETAVAFPPEVLAEAADVAQNERALYRAAAEALQSELDDPAEPGRAARAGAEPSSRPGSTS